MDIHEARRLLQLPEKKQLSPKDIKTAYHRMCLKTHPDKHGGDKGRFIKVHEAYELLTATRPRPSPSWTSIIAFAVTLANMVKDLYFDMISPPVPTHIFRPTLDEMMNRMVGTVLVHGTLYYMPYWFDMVEYESNVWLICDPVLPTGVHIDDLGQLHVSRMLPALPKCLAHVKWPLDANVGVVTNAGLPVRNEQDMFNVSVVGPILIDCDG